MGSKVPTETEPLYWKLPDEFIDELGIKLFNKNDNAYIIEVHLDTKDVVISLFRNRGWSEEHYENTSEVPGSFKADYLFPLKDLPKKLKWSILRNLDPHYAKYL